MSIVPVRAEQPDYSHLTSKEIARRFAETKVKKIQVEKKVKEEAQKWLSESNQIMEYLKKYEATHKNDERMLAENQKRKEEENTQRNMRFKKGREVIPWANKVCQDMRKDYEGIEAYFSRAKEYFGV